jgi:hypothetical protein
MVEIQRDTEENSAFPSPAGEKEMAQYEKMHNRILFCIYDIFIA